VGGGLCFAEIVGLRTENFYKKNSCSNKEKKRKMTLQTECEIRIDSAGSVIIHSGSSGYFQMKTVEEFFLDESMKPPPQFMRYFQKMKLNNDDHI